LLEWSSILIDEDGISIPTARIISTANPEEDLYKFTFALDYHGHNIRRLDIDDTHQRTNPAACPEYGGKRITGNHLHIWNPEHGDKCVVPIWRKIRLHTYISLSCCKYAFYLSEGSLSDDILNMANTMIRVSDLQLAQRTKKPKNGFYAQVEELIKEITPVKEDIERKKTLEGKSGKKYHPAYFIKNANAVIEPLAHPVQAVDWTKIASVFQEFYDLNKAGANYELYAILDDENNDWPDEPKILLSDVAKILLWSRRKQWKDKILKAVA